MDITQSASLRSSSGPVSTHKHSSLNLESHFKILSTIPPPNEKELFLENSLLPEMLRSDHPATANSLPIVKRTVQAFVAAMEQFCFAGQATAGVHGTNGCFTGQTNTCWCARNGKRLWMFYWNDNLLVCTER